jgi:hypothetical protein
VPSHAGSARRQSAGSRRILDRRLCRRPVRLRHPVWRRCVGGDTTRGPRNLCLTAIGELPAGTALRRDGALPGDDLWVSGQPVWQPSDSPTCRARTRLPEELPNTASCPAASVAARRTGVVPARPGARRDRRLRRPARRPRPYRRTFRVGAESLCRATATAAGRMRAAAGSQAVSWLAETTTNSCSPPHPTKRSELAALAGELALPLWRCGQHRRRASRRSRGIRMKTDSF